MINPFEAIEQRLINIETLVYKINEQGTEFSKKEENELLGAKEAASFLGISKSSIYSKSRSGEIPSMKRGGRLYFLKQQLIDYVKSGSKKSNAEIEQEAEAYLSRLKKGGQQ